MRICYCEDEEAQTKRLKNEIQNWSAKSNTVVLVDTFQSAEEFLFCEEELSYQLYFLDISMKKMNGMELARRIREKDKEALIVFVTSDPSFVFEGYEVDAFRYLMKPFKSENIYEILQHAYEQGFEESPSIIVRSDSENLRINLLEVLYLEVQGHYVNIHLKDQQVVVKSSFSSLLKEMNEVKEIMIQTHRSYAVNISKLKKIGRMECKLENDELIPISKAMYHSLNDSFIKYHMERQ